MWLERDAPPEAETSRDLCVYQTPVWVCEELVSSRYPWLSSSDRVLEPTCGEGHWLQVIPDDVPAIGIEVDERRASIARERTGRDVIVGDALSVDLSHSALSLTRYAKGEKHPFTPSVILGNPPFRATFVDAMLDRAHAWLPDGGSCGLILPVFLMHEAERVVRERQRWSIEMEALPRSIFPRLRLPVVFARFEKRERRTLVGFALFDECVAFSQLSTRVKHLLTNGRSPVWREVVFDAIRANGGSAHLQTIYAAIERRRPTPNPFWREKIRQTVQRYCTRVAPATWSIPEEIPA